MNSMQNNRNRIRRMVLISLFCAMAYAVTFVFHIKVVFMTFDVKDTVICLSSMILGPMASVLVALIVSVVELFTVSDTGLWGFLMNFLSSAVFAALSGWIYRKKKTTLGAVAGLGVSVVAGTAAMLLLDMLIVPLYMGNVSSNQVAGMIPELLLPFNFVKYLLNAALVMLLLRPISLALSKSGLLAAETGKRSSRFSEIFVLVMSGCICIGCLMILLLVMNGIITIF